MQRGAGGRAVERGGAGADGVGSVEQAGGLPRRRKAEPTERDVRRVPGCADGARSYGVGDVQRSKDAYQQILRQARPIAASDGVGDNTGAGRSAVRCWFHSDVRVVVGEAGGEKIGILVAGFSQFGILFGHAPPPLLP